jgi:hypothetical protein
MASCSKNHMRTCTRPDTKTFAAAAEGMHRRTKMQQKAAKYHMLITMMYVLLFTPQPWQQVTSQHTYGRHSVVSTTWPLVRTLVTHT